MPAFLGVRSPNIRSPNSDKIPTAGKVIQEIAEEVKPLVSLLCVNLCHLEDPITIHWNITHQEAIELLYAYSTLHKLTFSHCEKGPFDVVIVLGPINDGIGL